MRQGRMIIRGFVLVLLAGSMLGGVASARDSLVVKIKRHATLREGGQVVNVKVKVACDPARGEVLEAFVYVTQDGNESDFAGIPVVCDNKLRTYKVRVAAFPESPLRRGKARASAYVLQVDPVTEETTSGQDTRIILIR